MKFYYPFLTDFSIICRFLEFTFFFTLYSWEGNVKKMLIGKQNSDEMPEGVFFFMFLNADFVDIYFDLEKFLFIN